MNINNKYSGFEKMLKNKFSNFESPYNHKEWEDFKKELPKSTHSVFSTKILLKFFVIAAAIVVPLVTILHFTSKNGNKKETISDIKQINKQENTNHNKDNNTQTQMNHSENNVANNNSKSKSSKTLLISGNSSLSKLRPTQKAGDQKMNSTNTSNDNPVVNKPIKDNLKVNSNYSNQFNGDFISADFNEGCAPLKVQFSPLISSDTISYSWTFDDGKSSTKIAPSHVYDNAGSYNVSLSVKFAKSGITRKITYSKIINVK
ncbi:MAG: PKD domain-containing protein [Bacteroidales bacterium]